MGNFADQQVVRCLMNEKSDMTRRRVNMRCENNESGSIRFNLAIIGSLLLMAPLIPKISKGNITLVDILLRWGIAFCFVGAIVTILSFAFSHQPDRGHARPRELEPPLEEIEAAIREFRDQVGLDDSDITDAELPENDDSYYDQSSTLTHDFGDGPLDVDIADWASGADAQPSNRRATDH